MNILLYSLQAGIGLTLMYAFYRAFLVRLTFYKANRFYLAGYTLLSLLVPLLNTSGLWPRPVERSIVHVVPNFVDSPTVTAGTTSPVTTTNVAGLPPAHSIDIAQILLYALITGMLIMLVRLAVQVISLIRLRRKAVLLADTPGMGIKVFAMADPVAPFSFGRSIFIHLSAREMPDFRRILEHEQAHIRQRHTLDILLTQLVLVLQWWNPIAWLLNRSIRQNLEFLADQSVIDHGADTRQYQYLLLRVSGIGVPALSNPFNFSPLKNRITMMNKQRSGRRQFVRFLFALPLLVLLLVAASRHRDEVGKAYHVVRSMVDAVARKPVAAAVVKGPLPAPHPAAANRRHRSGDVTGKQFFQFTGFIFDSFTIMPLAGVEVSDKVSGRHATTDKEGFFHIAFPVSGPTDTVNVQIVCIKDGYQEDVYPRRFYLKYLEDVSTQWGGTLEFHGLKRLTGARSGFSAGFGLDAGEAASILTNGSFEREHRFDEFRKQWWRDASPTALFAANPTKIYFVRDGVSYIVFKNGYEAMAGKDNEILVNGKQTMTGEELNATYTRSQLDESSETLSKELAKKKYGIDKDLFVIHTKAQP